MILNSGLDSACELDAASSGGAFASASYPYFCRFIQYAAFGTGSAAPDPSDVTLNAQVGTRSNSRGGFSNIENGGRDAGGNTIWYEVTFTRVFSIAGNVNATEWGLAPNASGDLSVRELFRSDPNDNGSSPIPLTLETGDELQLVITLRVEAQWEYAAKSFVIAGAPGKDSNGTHDGQATVTSGSSNTVSGIRDALQVVWPGGYGVSQHAAVRWCSADQTSRTKSQDLTNWSNGQSLSALGYSPGNHYRDTTVTWGTSEGNGNHYAWEVTPNAAINGYRFILTSPTFLAKLNTHRLTLTLRKGIARL